MKKELLAPAGDIEAGYAALYYGADAVYLGLQQFSARATAVNFDEAALAEFCGYAHSLKRKVFVALNTLLQEAELPDLIKNLDICRRCKVDALIIQDFGVARVVQKQYPDLEMHASTQMAVHNKEGALALQKIGFKRVVLARELSLAEIKLIAEIPGLETEAFIHGALCYSYSGLCMFSSVETGRSANRGKCLYPCREEFLGTSGEKHYFSMKDMALQEDVLKMPVTSLKIEGRKKSALYVAAVTDYYRKILDGKGADAQKAENIQQIFARPWCKFHFNGRDKEIVDRDFVGHRGLLIGKIEQVLKGRLAFRTKHPVARYDGLQIDILGREKPFGFSLQNMKVDGKSVFEASAGALVEVVMPNQTPPLQKGWDIYLSSSNRVKQAYNYSKPKPGEYRGRSEIVVRVIITKDKVRAECAGFEAEILGEFALASDPKKVQLAIEVAFAKTGDTNFSLGSLEVENPQQLFVPVSLLNELRRQLYAQIKIEDMTGGLAEIAPVRKSTTAKWLLKTDNVALLSGLDLEQFEEVIFLLSPKTKIEDLRVIPKNKLRLALPALCRQPGIFESLISSLWGMGYKKWEIGNYWGLQALPAKGIDLSFDSSLYMMNSQALQMAKDCGASRACLSVEDNLHNWQKLAQISPLPICLVVYQDVALFSSAGCIRDNACKNCQQGKKWMEMSKNGAKYQVLSQNCQTMLFADKALSFGAEAKEVSADFYRIDLLYKEYSIKKAAEIIQELRDSQDPLLSQKANLYRKI